MTALWSSSYQLPGVQNSRELQRVFALPRRTWSEDRAFAAELSKSFRAPGGTQTLFPVQAQALFELWYYGWLFAAIATGLGKTLVGYLSPHVVKSLRPLFVMPAKLIPVYKERGRTLAEHWLIPNHIHFMSYELAGRKQSQGFLESYRPDYIFADEAHYLKNPDAAVTIRFRRYLEAHPTRFVPASGSFWNRSILDCAHLQIWALGASAPVPLSPGDLEEWSQALDEKLENRRGPGALRMFFNEDDAKLPELSAVRSAMRRRLAETPGAIVTSENLLGATLTIAPLECALPKMEPAFKLLREDWTTPDGEQSFGDVKFQVWACARQLALGFFYRWDPQPPREWKERRKEFYSWCRYILINNHRHLDSLSMVVDAIDAGFYPAAEDALRAWREIEPTFTPTTKDFWLDYDAIHKAVEWGQKEPGIIWTEHVEFARTLARESGFTYYGEEGKDDQGRPIPEWPKGGDKTVVASIFSSGTGRDLQKWHRNLVTSFPTTNKLAEQFLARTHRTLQEASEVTFDVMCNAWEQWSGFDQCLRDARFVEEISGNKQKILYADNLMPSIYDVTKKSGYKWHS